MATATRPQQAKEATIRGELSPVYAAVGVADRAVTALLEVPSRMTEIGGRVQQRVATLQHEARELREQAPERVKELSEKAQHYVTGLAGEAGTTYGELVRRGEQLVRNVASQPQVVQFEEQAKAATAKVKAARTTARKGAAATQVSAKAAVTSMTKAAEAATDAISGVVEVARERVAPAAAPKDTAKTADTEPAPKAKVKVVKPTRAKAASRTAKPADRATKAAKPAGETEPVAETAKPVAGTTTSTTKQVANAAAPEAAATDLPEAKDAKGVKDASKE